MDGRDRNTQDPSSIVTRLPSVGRQRPGMVALHCMAEPIPWQAVAAVREWPQVSAACPHAWRGLGALGAGFTWKTPVGAWIPRPRVTSALDGH